MSTASTTGSTSCFAPMCSRGPKARSSSRADVYKRQLIFLLDLVPSAKPPYLLVVNSTDTEIDPALNELLNRYAKGARVKSRSVSADRLDLILELRTDDGSRLVSACAALPGVESVNLLAHDGEVRY